MPEDRKHQAIFPALGIQPNFSVASLKAYAGALGFMAEGRERRDLADYRNMLNIRMARPDQLIAGFPAATSRR